MTNINELNPTITPDIEFEPLSLEISKNYMYLALGLLNHSILIFHRKGEKDKFQFLAELEVY